MSADVLAEVKSVEQVVGRFAALRAQPVNPPERQDKVRDEITLSSDSFFPDARSSPTIMICDFEVKHADVVGIVARKLRVRYPETELYFAVFGAMTKGTDLEVNSFDELTGARIMRDANFATVFVAATMSPPGIEPPLELR